MDRDKTIKAGNAISKALSENKFELFNRPMYEYRPANNAESMRVEKLLVELNNPYTKTWNEYGQGKHQIIVKLPD